jgi:DNA-binding transcriptional LysR family regulator
MRLDLTTFRIFLAVYNLKSLTAAAEREHIAPSAASRRIHDLELDLDTPLFRRHPRGVTPTEAGEALVRHVQRLFDDLKGLEADLGDYAQGLKGQIRIHAHSSAVIQYLPQDIAGFLERHPNVSVDLREEPSNAVLQSVVDGVADLGIFGGNVVPPPGTRALDYRRDQLMAVLPVRHPLATREMIPFDDIRDADHISLESSSSLQTLLAGAAEASGGRLNIKIEVSTFEAAWRMVEAGLGLAVIPAGIVALAARDGRIAAVALSDAWAHRRLMICVKDSHNLSAAARHMLTHLTKAADVTSPAEKPPILDGEWQQTLVPG